LGDTDGTPKSYDMDVIYDPVILRQFLHQIELDFNRIFFFGKAELTAYAFNMCIDHNTWNMIDIPSYYIGGLASDTGK
jgi:hypothetical protein